VWNAVFMTWYIPIPVFLGGLKSILFTYAEGLQTLQFDFTMPRVSTSSSRSAKLSSFIQEFAENVFRTDVEIFLLQVVWRETCGRKAIYCAAAL
jgi:hypothetical protein